MKVSTEQKNAFRRAAQLLGHSQSAIIQRAVIKAIRIAREQYGAKFDCRTMEEEMCLEAISEGFKHELSEIAEYANLPESAASAALGSLIKMRLVDQRVRGLAVPRTNAGKRQALYFIAE